MPHAATTTGRTKGWRAGSSVCDPPLHTIVECKPRKVAFLVLGQLPATKRNATQNSNKCRKHDRASAVHDSGPQNNIGTTNNLNNENTQNEQTNAVRGAPGSVSRCRQLPQKHAHPVCRSVVKHFSSRENPLTAGQDWSCCHFPPSRGISSCVLVRIEV